MTSKLEALRALHDAVKAGGKRNAALGVNALFPYHQGRRALRAYDGSLDAAHALHKAILPGWVVAEIAQDAPMAWAVRLGHVSELRETADGTDSCPARAWLLAIISALIAQEAE